MFKTYESEKRFSFFSEQGEHDWSSVEISLTLPWYYAVCSVLCEGGVEISSNFCFSDVQQLNDISTQKNVDLKFVGLVSPGYLNGTGNWKMEPLSEIWLCANDDNPSQYEYVYLLKNGTTYRDETPPQPNEWTGSNRQIFKI